ncbi:MAG: hypothetical protein ACI9O2_000658 [Flammeovirgaceae bacterium]|jgi:hypothetical protein
MNFQFVFFIPMLDKTIAVGGVSMTLILYTMFASTCILLNWVAPTFAVSPVIIIWMVWVVLKYGEHKNEELKEEQEFGYVDRPELGIQKI